MSVKPDIENNDDKHVKEYFDQLGFDVKKLLKKKMANMKQAETTPFDIPEIEEDVEPTSPEVSGGMNGGIAVDAVLTDSEDIDAIKLELEELRRLLQEASVGQQLKDVKTEIIDEFEHTIHDLQTELNEIKERKVPEAGGFDTGGLYKEKIYDIVTRVLDKLLVPLFEDIPDYSLIANQVSRTYDDGTVSDAIVAVGVTVPNSGYRYDFKIDVPILNGIIQYPTYLQRGLKVIPLTKEKLFEELNSMAFRKLEVEAPYTQENIFNSIGDNIHKRPDEQKWYDVKSTEPKPSALPSRSRWPTHRIKEVKNE